MKILIADDHPIFRAGLKEFLTKESDIDLIGEAADGRKVLELAKRRRWDLVVLDLKMPGRDGLQVLQELRRERPELPILVLTAHPEDQLAITCLRAGAAGYLSKIQTPQVLLAAIRKLAGGAKYISQSLTEKIITELGSTASNAPHEFLSVREYQIMRMIAAGKSVKEIASELTLNVRTVRTYRARVLEKMHMRNDGEIIRYTLERQLID